MQKEVKYYHLLAIRNGDKGSLRWLYDQYHKLIYHYCLKLVRQKALAEEATADVFITIWQKRHMINPEAPFDPLLYKIAKDLSYNYLKRIAANDRLKQAFLNSTPSAYSKNGEIILIETEAVGSIYAIVEKLPPKRKEIFKLRYFDGMNNQAIAEQLNISTNTVREHLARARKFLKENYDLNESGLALLLLLLNS